MIVKEKIRKALKPLTLRGIRHLIQFWSPCSIRKHKLLNTIDQPFVLVIPDEGLRNYRRESERIWFPVDEECEEEDLSPVQRVFRQGLPEWTSDVTNYFSKNYPQQDCAVRWNLHGYLVLPVFDASTMLCVGVLEVITSLKYLDCAYEVQEIHRALKAVNLTSPQAFSCPTSYVVNEKRRQALCEILRTLKDICDTYKLPLAQTWTLSLMNSFVATQRNIKKACSSFNTSCIGRLCMSTVGLPFYYHDSRFSFYQEACEEHHLLQSQGVVGKAMSSHGSCFCGDISKLGDTEYSLVDKAIISGLTSCFAIYLHSIEHNDAYVLEFFLPVDMKKDEDLQNLVTKIKGVKFSSGFELGNQLSTEVLGEATKLSLAMQPETILSSMSEQLHSNDMQTIGEANVDHYCIIAQDQDDFGNDQKSDAITMVEEMGMDEVTSKKFDVATTEEGYNSREGKVYSKQRRKRVRDYLTSETIQQYFGKSINEASKSLGVSRSTMKRVCRELNILSWPLPQRSKKNSHFGIFGAVFLLVRVKRWICSSNRHGFSAKWWICGKHNNFVSKSKLPSEAYLSSSIWSAGQSISYPLNFSQPLNETDVMVAPSSKSPHARLGVYEVARLLLGLKRWRKRVVSIMPTKVLHTRTVTVKATFNDDMIKFNFPIASGLLGLEKEVAKRIKLNGRSLHLKYRDEDDDMILIACDADLHNLALFTFASSSNTVKLIVEMAES